MADGGDGLRAAHRYAAFLSYSHQDSEIGEWLQARLENYRVPSPLVGRTGFGGAIGKRLGKVFRDRADLSAAHDLGEEIRGALEKSDALIVLCSPRSAASKYVQAEIRAFKALGRGQRIFAAIVDGEPHAAGKPGRTAAEECFPPALLYQIGGDGEISSLPESNEPIAADIRKDKDGRENGALKLIAGLLDVGLDELVQRERQAERRRRARATALAATMAVLALVAAGGGVIAWLQGELARERELLAREQLMQSMTSVGRMNVRSDPALAVQLSLAAFDVWPDKAPIDLLRTAIRQSPPWARIGPAGVAPPRMELTVPDISPTDVFAADPAIDYVLVREGEMESFSRGLPGADIRLRKVPDGAEAGRLKLGPGEYFLTPLESTTELFASRGANTIKVYRLAPDGFGRPVAQADGVVDVAFTGGRFPVHFLSADGSILTIRSPGAQPERSAVPVPRAHTILARPDGAAVVLLSEGKLHPLVTEGGRLAPRPAIAIDSIPALADRLREGFYEDRVKLAWGPLPSQVLLASYAEQDTEVRAVDMLAGYASTIHRARFHENGLNQWVFAANADATRFVLSEETDDQPVSRVVDVAWLEAGDRAVARATLPAAGALRGREAEDSATSLPISGYRTSFPVAAEFAPSGAFLVVAHYLKSRDNDGGTAINGVGVLESFDISQLTRTEGEEFRDCDSLHIEGPGYARSVVLQPEAVFDLDATEPERLGTAPLVRVAYSSNSERVAALDSRGVYHVFRVRVSHGFDRAPEAWTRRLCDPDIQVHGRQGRFVDVTYGDGERTVYDQEARTKTRLDQPGQPIVGVSLASPDALLLVGARGSSLLKGERITTVSTFPFEVERMIDGDGVVLAYGPSGALILDQGNGQVIGRIQGPSEREFVRQLNEELDLDNSSQASLARPRRTADGVITLATENSGAAQVWRLAPSAAGVLTPEPPVAPIPMGSMERRGWMSVRRLAATETLWANEGNYSNVTIVRQIDLATGRDVARYAPPAAGWPEQTFEVEAAMQAGSYALVLLRYYGGEGRSGYAVGKWSIDGGPCLDWHDLGALEDNPIHVVAEPDGSQARALFWIDRQGSRAAYIDLLTGRRLWEGTVDGESAFPPQMVNKSGTWSPDLGDFYRAVSLDVHMRGRDYWQGMTMIELPEEQRERISRLSASRLF